MYKPPPKPVERTPAVPELPPQAPKGDELLKVLRLIAQHLAKPSTSERLLAEHHDLQKQIVSLLTIQNKYITKHTRDGEYFDSGTRRATVSTPTAPLDQNMIAVPPATPGYDIVEIYSILKRIAPELHVINDGTSLAGVDKSIFVRSSTDGSVFSREVQIPYGESKTFFNVYELRVRAPNGDDLGTNGTSYRVTEYNFSLTYFTPIVNVTIPSVNANRSDFTAQNVSVGLADTALPDIVIPDGYGLIIRANVDNTGKVYVSRTDATVAANRNSLNAGDFVKLYITNANLAHVAASLAAQSVDLIVEL